MKKEPIVVRRIRPDEWSKHRDIRIRMLTEAPNVFGSTAEGESALADGVWKAWAKSRSQGNEEAMFVAASGDQWVGCAIGSRADHDPTVVRVWAMWIEPEWRSLTLGSELLTRVREWAVSAGYRKLWLKVAETNERAQRLYERSGFEVTGERIGMKRNRAIPMIVMEMDLRD